GQWAMASVATPQPVRGGDRAPDLPLWLQDGPTSLHQLTRENFVALYFTDTRRRPRLPDDQPGLVHKLVSRWDAPLDSNLRTRSLFDPGATTQKRLGVDDGTVVLLRPDAHV